RAASSDVSSELSKVYATAHLGRRGLCGGIASLCNRQRHDVQLQKIVTMRQGNADPTQTVRAMIGPSNYRISQGFTSCCSTTTPPRAIQRAYRQSAQSALSSSSS
ncbi:hypothetical protein ABVT39_024344, partial [Epinephelus coioides]